MSFELNIILLKTLCMALMTPVEIITAQLVAALTSGFRQEPGGKMKSKGAKVALLTGR